jgi:N-acyl-phosphatidylethanolamine-hydrolysing phospholipase D
MLKWPLAGVNIATAAIISIAILSYFGNSHAQNDSVAKAHHTPTGFKNNYAQQVNKSFGDFLRWQWESWGLSKTPSRPTPSVQADLALLKAPTSPTVTWIGHATALVQANGLNVLIDPIFSERASPVKFFGPKRAQPPGVAMSDLPDIDAVLISHNHYDHLDRFSVAQLDEKAKAASKTTLFIVPLGLKAWFNSIGIDSVVELDWWEHHTLVCPQHQRPQRYLMGRLGGAGRRFPLVLRGRHRLQPRFCGHSQAVCTAPN